MKKYEKPQILFESFVLSQSIATCAYDMSNSTTVEQCSAVGDDDSDYPGMSFFTDISVCELLLEGSEFEHYCYTNGVDSPGTIQLFNS